MEEPRKDVELYGNTYDKATELVYECREHDWRNGAIVYQVLVDRFAPPANVEAKRALYPSPKVLRRWSEVPKRGHYVESASLWSHEIEFWGGDFDSLRHKLDYVAELGIDVLYLNPIHLGYTNHKYDALDYSAVSPEYGSRGDVAELAEALHAQGMKLVLDGVFNHMGRHSALFQSAVNDVNSEFRDWFYFGEQYPSGHRSWAGAVNLPELNLENSKVRDHVYGAENSVVRSYLREGVDGWRLDVAFDIGFNWLEELSDAAHQEKPGSLVVGEIWNYPEQWFPSVDGVMNFTAREIIWRTCLGQIEPSTAMRMLDRMIEDAGIEHMLKSWLVLDNHDTPRLKNMLPEAWQQRMAQVLQFTLPGSPNLYYGTELGMAGGDDPEMRAPMRWDWVDESNFTLRWTRDLIEVRKQHRALVIGNFRSIPSVNLVAFERYTNRAEDTVIVIANPTQDTVSEFLMIPNSKLMNDGEFEKLLPSKAEVHGFRAAMLNVSVPAGETVVLKPCLENANGYSAYKRVL